MGELRKIPNIGKATERDLTEMGYTTIESLKGKSAQQLYEEECALRGYVLDRCQLYLYRAVEYWLNTEGADPRRCRWWYFMDEYIQPSPCGAICAACARFPDACGGCRSIKGKVWWLAYAGMERCPVYDYTIHDRSGETVEVRPTKVIIIEGILIFENQALRDLMDIKIFVDADADVRILRRIMRDVKKRGRSLDSVVNQYLTTVKPMHQQFVEPSKRYADIVVLEGGHNLVALDMIIQRIRSHVAG